MPAPAVTSQHKAAFDAFGFVVIPGLFASDIGWILDDYEAAWRARPEVVHTSESKTTSYPGLFVASRPRLSALIEDPRIVGLCDTLLGEGYTLCGGDGGLYNGDTAYHSDMPQPCEKEAGIVRHMKVALYLDPLTSATGALRVIPGTHHSGDRYREQAPHTIWQAKLSHEQVPACALETRPGDVIAFDHRLMHGSFGGGGRRRMFCLNVHGPVRDQRERDAAMAYYRMLRDPPYNVDWIAYDKHFPTGWFESLPPARRACLEKFLEFGAEVMREKTEAVPV